MIDIVSILSGYFTSGAVIYLCGIKQSRGIMASVKLIVAAILVACLSEVSVAQTGSTVLSKTSDTSWVLSGICDGVDQSVSLVASGSSVITEWFPEPNYFSLDRPVTYYVNISDLKTSDSVIIIFNGDTVTLR